MKRLAVLGGGAWGSALASTAARAGGTVIMWARDPAIVAAVNRQSQNPIYLPGVELHPDVRATSRASEALDAAEAAILAVPAQFLRGVLSQLRPLLPASLPVLLCAKGIEAESLKTMSEVARETLGDTPLAVLSGPSFAAEVARGLPAAVTIAAHDPALARDFVEALGTPRFRPYVSTDPRGAELGGAIKNVMAIASGIIDGRGLGDNARAALITRGLAEMMRLGVQMGAQAETFSGLSGLGDLVLTCTAGQSRNHRLGVALGRGTALAAALPARSVVEGVATAAAVARLASRLGVDMPITAAVDGVLHRGMAIDMMIEGLLSRPYRSE